MRNAPTVVRATALLAALAIQAATARPASAQDATEVPLSARGGRMVVPARAADGTELSFLVSTASTVTVLSQSGAAKVAGGDVTMGGLPVNMAGAVTLPDTDFTVDGVVMDGLVSNNTLNEFDVLFDMPGGRLVLKPFGRSVEWPGMVLSDPVRLRVYHGLVLALDLEIDGTPYPAMLELGADVLLANEAVFNDNDITDGTADLTLGAVTFADLPIRVSDQPIIGRFSPNGDGFVLVGAPPAMDCAIAISWVHREMRTCVR